MDWEALRDDYPTLARVTYLNSCSLGALSRQCREAHTRFLDAWTDLGASAWYELWLGEIDAWRKATARLLGCSAKEVAWTYAVGPALGTLASALDRQNLTGDGRWAGRTGVLAADLEFPSTTAAFAPHPQRRLRWLRSDGVQVPAAAYKEALTSDTQAVVASRVFYATGALQDVSGITKAARDAGALCIVDDYHGTGQVPVDVHKNGIDVLVGGALKWLCGGPVSAFLYVRRKLVDDLEPLHAGWWANETMFDWDLETFRYWKDARRFEGGTVNLHGVFMARAATERVLELGMDRIRDRVRALATDLEERLEDAGWTLRSHPDPARRTGIVMVEHPQDKTTVTRLAKGTVGAADPAERPIIVDDRPGAVRVSPHFYNAVEENERVVEALGRG